jgi:hypothetical protein
VVSNVTGKVMSELPTAEYWVKHARGMVSFRSGVTTAATELKCNVFLEVGAQPHLSRHVEDILTALGAAAFVIPTLRKGRSDVARVQMAAAGLHVAGVGLAWDRLTLGGRRVRLPPPQLTGDRYWVKKQAGPTILSMDGDGAARGDQQANMMAGMMGMMQQQNAMHARPGGPVALPIVETRDERCTWVVDWKPSPLPPAETKTTIKTCLVFGDLAGFCDRVALTLEAEGVFAVSEMKSSDVHQAWVQSELEKGRGQWDLILFGWGLDAPEEGAENERLLEHRRALRALFMLLQCVMKNPTR